MKGAETGGGPMVRIAVATLLIALAGCSDGGDDEESAPPPPDWTGTWTGTHTAASSEALTVTIAGVECGNSICTFTGSWSTPSKTAPLEASYFLTTEGTWGFNWSLVYAAGCEGADLALGAWNEAAQRIEGETGGDCTTDGTFVLTRS